MDRHVEQGQMRAHPFDTVGDVRTPAAMTGLALELRLVAEQTQLLVVIGSGGCRLLMGGHVGGTLAMDRHVEQGQMRAHPFDTGGTCEYLRQ